LVTADLVKASATTKRAVESSPLPRILSGFLSVRTSPTARNSSWLTVTGAAFFGLLAAPGISPPSKAPRSAAAAIAPTLTTS